MTSGYILQQNYNQKPPRQMRNTAAPNTVKCNRAALYLKKKKAEVERNVF